MAANPDEVRQSSGFDDFVDIFLDSRFGLGQRLWQHGAIVKFSISDMKYS